MVLTAEMVTDLATHLDLAMVATVHLDLETLRVED
jgi:hypothetical protein